MKCTCDTNDSTFILNVFFNQNEVDLGVLFHDYAISFLEDYHFGGEKIIQKQKLLRCLPQCDQKHLVEYML